MDVQNPERPQECATTAEVRNLETKLDERMNCLDDEIAHTLQGLRATRRQVLWTMAQTVREDRVKAAHQFVMMGWADGGLPADTARIQREEEIMRLLANAKVNSTGIEFSHSTSAMASLSKMTIVTLKASGERRRVLEAAGSFTLRSGEKILVRPQIALFDRLSSLPAKAAMTSISRTYPSAKSAFKPRWREQLVELPGGIAMKWQVDLQHAEITMHVPGTVIKLLKNDIERELDQLQFGRMSDAPARGPTPASQAWKERGELVRTHLNDLRLTEFPFAIVLKELPATEWPELLRASANKRGSEEAPSQAAKRPSPSPPRYQPPLPETAGPPLPPDALNGSASSMYSR